MIDDVVDDVLDDVFNHVVDDVVDDVVHVVVDDDVDDDVDDVVDDVDDVDDVDGWWLMTDVDVDVDVDDYSKLTDLLRNSAALLLGGGVRTVWEGYGPTAPGPKVLLRCIVI